MPATSADKVCPFCAETIKAAAVVCRYCGRDLPSSGPSAAPEPPTAAAVFHPHGIKQEDGRYTWGGCYFRTLEQATEYVERHKGLPPPPAPRSAPAAQPAKPFKWWLWGPVGLVVAIFAVGVANGPKTYADVAEMEYRSCMRSSGDGHWRASSGVTLETFCRSAGNIEARREFCKAHPESC